jgi:septal ring factor EnvC (AmiA/AmiB activator)
VDLVKKGEELVALNDQLQQIKNQYRIMIIQAYKKRNPSNNLMYIVSSKTYNIALNRAVLLRQITSLRKKQAALIALQKNRLAEQMGSINLEKTNKLLASNEKINEKHRIELDKKQKEASYNKLLIDEASLLKQMRSDEEKKRKIGRQIQNAILAEEKKEADKKKKTNSKTSANSKDKKNNAAKNNTSKSASKPTTQTTGSVEKISSEGNVAGHNFEANRGSLPSPVTKGSITGKFGKTPHPQLKNVFENNNGIDITCSAGSTVRAVFDGEVSSVFSIPGAGTVVIIKHGNYRSVYSNLGGVLVRAGAKVSTKQSLGTLLSAGNVSVLHFEIHRVSGQSTVPQNPLIWINP